MIQIRIEINCMSYCIIYIAIYTIIKAHINAGTASAAAVALNYSSCIGNDISAYN